MANELKELKLQAQNTTRKIAYRLHKEGKTPEQIKKGLWEIFNRDYPHMIDLIIA